MTKDEALKLVLADIEANIAAVRTSTITAIKEALAQPQQELNLAEAFRTELDKLSQRNYELRMENAQLKAQPQQEPQGKHIFHDANGNVVAHLDATAEITMDYAKPSALAKAEQPPLNEQELVAVYGYCPECGAKGVQRERRPNGNDKCVNGHTYPSSKASPTQPPLNEQEPVDEQAIFEGWIARNRPSGDADSVQREWEASGEYADLYTSPPQRKPLNSVLVPLDVLEAAEESLGSFCSDHGWGDKDMQNMDNLSAYIAQHKAAHNIKE